MFEKLIEAARTCHESGNPIDECCIEGCPNFDSQPYCLDQILKDCVEALTQSSAELKDKDYLIQQQTYEIQRLMADVKRQQEKMFELAKKLPKRGEFVYVHGDGVTCCDGWECSVCGKTYHTNVPYFGEYKFCPNCGAKMEAQDADT